MELDLSSPRAAAAEDVDDDGEGATAENEKRAGVNVEFMGMKCCAAAICNAMSSEKFKFGGKIWAIYS